MCQIYAEFVDLCRPGLTASTARDALRVPGLPGWPGFPGRLARAQLDHASVRKVRYGELPEDQRQMDAIEAAWKRLSQEGERVK
jgi:hypothetical protein